MSTWSEGYVSDINYTYGYYKELNPNQLAIPFLMANIAVPTIINACELGFGQGLSLNINAATGTAKWYATDFNPEHAVFSQTLANHADPQRLLIAEQGFNEFCQRDDLPEFDFIGLHGIWSWISDDNRKIIVDFIRRKLKIGGVLYISYNTLPGWSAPSPLRHLLLEHERIGSSKINTRADNTKQAIENTIKTLEHSHQLQQSAPQLFERTKNLLNQNAHYIAHEYLNRDWKPMYYAELEKWLEPAKLSFACSARYLDDFPNSLFTEEQQTYLNSITNPSLQQTVKDYLLNKQFRCDYWVKGKRFLNSSERHHQWQQLQVILLKPAKEIELTATNHRTAQLNPQIFEPLLKILADQQIHLVKDLVTELANKLTLEQIYTALAVLFAKQELATVQPAESIKQNKTVCQTLNRYLLDFARSDQKINFLASPVIGTAWEIGRFDQLFLIAYMQQLPTEKYTEFVWQILKDHNQQLIKDGKQLTTEQENLQHIEKLKQIFLEQKLKLAKSLGIVE